MERSPGLRAGSWDLLRIPVLGSLILKRRLWQGLLLAGALVLVVHGFLGPQLAPKNLATLAVWVHYRGLLILALLVVGNVFCMACPFMLARDAARRFLTPRWSWPRLLRGKAVGIGLLVGVLFSYELWDWWGSPAATAGLIVGYFAVAMLVDALFRGAPFCKSVCPIGQFNFIASTLSPLEVRAREPSVCSSCRGHECLTGAPAAPMVPAARGCEMGLFIPSKAGNMDCTFCMDCVRACPEDNVALAARAPAEELFDERSGAGVGRLSERTDISLLAVAFTFGALANAFGMVSPVYALQRSMAEAVGTTNEGVVLGMLFTLLLVVEPALLLGGAALLSRRALPGRPSAWVVMTRFARGLVPLGVGVWAAHYGFHLFTGLWTIVPVAQSAAADTGLAFLGTPSWGVGGLSVRAVQPIETGLLLLGLCGSLMVIQRIARQEAPDRPRAAALPWATLAVLLFSAALWLMAQPMEMRGTFLDP
jgi:polyferredoxin